VSPSWIHDLEALAQPIVTAVSLPIRHVLRWGAARTGLPVVVVGMIAAVVAWRVGRRSWPVAVELALALGVLLLATRLGWIRW
jgi:hypothetical protein